MSVAVIKCEGCHKYSRVKDPVLNTAVGLIALLSSLVPEVLDLRDQCVLILLGTLLDLLALGGDVVLQLGGVPGVVWLDSVVLPVVLDKVLEVLAVRGCWVWNVVIRQPSLELGLVPLVVCCTASELVRRDSGQ